MTNSTTNEIWVFGDLRTRHLLDLSLKVLRKAAGLACEIDARVALFVLSPAGADRVATAEDGACMMDRTLDSEAFACGADDLLRLENAHFASPTAHLFAAAIGPLIRQKAPRLVLFPLTEFGRDIAARTAAGARAGLMADCLTLTSGTDGNIVGLCPAWGGEVMAEITYKTKHATCFATVQPQGADGGTVPHRSGRVVSIPLDAPPESKAVRLLGVRPVPLTDDDLTKARTVVVGGAGLGSMQNFGLVRQLATAMAGQVGATRPPVLNHWVAENRLIGQTGKTVRPDLLVSIGTSGAIQYTAGIMDARTIVAINRDRSAPIFRLADIGVVADATTFLPLLVGQIRQVMMRQLADDICSEGTRPDRKPILAEKIRTLRKAQGWSAEHLAEITGQTPEFIADVESGEISPPVAFILRLAGAYGVDPGTFLRDEEKAHIRDQRAQAYVNRTRNYSYQTLTSGADHDHLRAFMVTIEPHHDHKPVAYKHEGEEFIFVMEGELQFTLGSRVHRLKKGESIHFHSNTPHKLKSLSAENTQCLVMLYTP